MTHIQLQRYGTEDFATMQKTSKKPIMRYDAVFHFLEIRKFTKQHLLRVLYLDKRNEWVASNGLRLEYSSVCENSLQQANRFELVYVMLTV